MAVVEGFAAWLEAQADRGDGVGRVAAALVAGDALDLVGDELSFAVLAWCRMTADGVEGERLASALSEGWAEWRSAWWAEVDEVARG